MFGAENTAIPKSLDTPVQSVVSSYAPTEVSDSDDDSRINTARSNLEKVTSCICQYVNCDQHLHLKYTCVYLCIYMCNCRC